MTKIWNAITVFVAAAVTSFAGIWLLVEAFSYLGLELLRNAGGIGFAVMGLLALNAATFLLLVTNRLVLAPATAITGGGGTHEKDDRFLSGGMIYILRHLESGSRSLGEIAEMLVQFQRSKGLQQLRPEEAAAWRKAAKYAMQCLHALGLVNHVGGDEYHITEAGAQLLGAKALRARFRSTFSKGLVESQRR